MCAFFCSACSVFFFYMMLTYVLFSSPLCYCQFIKRLWNSLLVFAHCPLLGWSFAYWAQRFTTPVHLIVEPQWCYSRLLSRRAAVDSAVARCSGRVRPVVFFQMWRIRLEGTMFGSRKFPSSILACLNSKDQFNSLPHSQCPHKILRKAIEVKGTQLSRSTVAGLNKEAVMAAYPGLNY